MNRLLFFSYIFILILFVAFSYLFIDANFSYLHVLFTGKNFSEGPLVSLCFFLFLVLFFSYYILLLLAYQKKQISTKNALTLFIVTIVILFFSYPAMLSFDIFNYIATSKVLFLYKENPYLIMPNAFLHDPILSFMHASNKTALYGPVWLVLTGIPFLFLFNFLLMLFSFKLFILLFFLGTLSILYLLSNKNIFPVLFFGFNPLVILETVVSGHNDIVMVFLAVISFYLLRQKKLFIASFFLLLSIGIKFATIFLLPVFLYIVYLQFSKRSINWENIFYYAGTAMLIVFFFSIFREEIYPWYAIWFMAFFVLSKRALIFSFVNVFSFSLLLRYLPYIYSGTHFGLTPVIKTVVTFGIPLVFFLLIYLNKKLRFINI